MRRKETHHTSKLFSWKSLGRHLIPNVGTLVMVALLLFAYNVWAAPASAPLASTSAANSTISYQGTLTDVNGDPITDNVDMTFRFYDVSNGGTALWTEAHTGANTIPVSAGLFQAMLGSLNPIPVDLWENSTIYLGVQVGSDPEMMPRPLVGKPPSSVADLALVAQSLASQGPGLIQTWDHPDNESVDATGDYTNKANFDTGISINVTDGPRYFVVTYRGLFQYDYDDRTGSHSTFYGKWMANLADNDVNIANQRLVQTGLNQSWSAFGSNSYWATPYSTSWVIELDEGVHDLTLKIAGYSNGTMDLAHFSSQKIDVLPLP